MSDDPKLSPEEEATYRRGMDMLKAVQSQKPPDAPTILGADGKPIEPPKVEKPEGTVRTPEEEAKFAAEQKENATKMARRKVEELDKEISLLMANDDIATAFNAVTHAWKFLYWFISELRQLKGVRDEHVQVTSDASRAAALSGAYNINELIAAIKKHDLPYMTRKAKEYASLRRLRDIREKKALSMFGPKGIALPCPQLRDLFKGKPFLIGDMILLYGVPEALGKAMACISDNHLKQNGGRPVFLSDTEEKKELACAMITIPKKWWVGASQNEEKLAAVLAPVVKQRASLVLIESLETIAAEKEAEMPLRNRKVRAMTYLYNWAFENQIAVIVGNPSTEDENIAGDIPKMHVGLQGAELTVGGIPLTF